MPDFLSLCTVLFLFVTPTRLRSIHIMQVFNSRGIQVSTEARKYVEKKWRLCFFGDCLTIIFQFDRHHPFFADLAPLNLFSNTRENTEWKEFLSQRRNCGYQCLFFEIKLILYILQKRSTIRKSLGWSI